MERVRMLQQLRSASVELPAPVQEALVSFVMAHRDHAAAKIAVDHAVALIAEKCPGRYDQVREAVVVTDPAARERLRQALEKAGRPK